MDMQLNVTFDYSDVKNNFQFSITFVTDEITKTEISTLDNQHIDLLIGSRHRIRTILLFYSVFATTYMHQTFTR